MKKHINYFIYFGHVFYNTTIAMLLFMISVPYVSKTKEALDKQNEPISIIFDAGGVLTQTNRQVAAKNLGLPLILKRIFWHFQGVSGAGIQKLFYKTLDHVAVQLDHHEAIMPSACDQDGNLLPILMRLWLAGKIRSNEIRELALINIDQHPEWFSNDTEQGIIKNLVSFIFTPELFVQTQYISDDTIQCIRQLKIAGYKLYVLSNWDQDSFLLLREQYADFFDLFDGCVVSGFEHVIKPDSTIYQILLQRYNLAPEQCIFIDDQEENVNAAQLERLTTILCKNPKSVFHAIRKYFLA